MYPPIYIIIFVRLHGGSIWLVAFTCYGGKNASLMPLVNNHNGISATNIAIYGE